MIAYIGNRWVNQNPNGETVGFTISSLKPWHLHFSLSHRQSTQASQAMFVKHSDLFLHLNEIMISSLPSTTKSVTAKKVKKNYINNLL